MVVHNLTVHPGVMWFVQSEPNLLVAGPCHCGQLCISLRVGGWGGVPRVVGVATGVARVEVGGDNPPLGKGGEDV